MYAKKTGCNLHRIQFVNNLQETVGLGAQATDSVRFYLLESVHNTADFASRSSS